MSSLIAYAILTGIFIGLYYSFMALGLNLIFGVLRIVNLAHGDFIMLSAYFAFWIYFFYSFSPLISLLIITPVFFFSGLALYYGIVKKLLKSKDSEMTSFIAFFGLSMAIESLTFIEFGASYRSLPLNFLPISYVTIFGFPMSFIIIFIGLFSVAAILITFFYLNNTKLGRSTKAMMSSKETAMAYGINISLVFALTFAIGLTITSIAGVFSPYIFGSIYPNEGVLITIIAFSIIIIGGLGNPIGTVFGGLIYGIIISIIDVYVPSWAYMFTFIILVVVIIIKPSGILGVNIREI